eukprot:TRINITY_DN578_c0_g1_i2.p1 TRINITY_DN578_c0_g1~~TRINITY_DN578_c0_g1_i2.p1  ORF type:complete len:118 (+),score=12.55 TRINITY_DN578_c0_g1_i2:258-611(+)
MSIAYDEDYILHDASSSVYEKAAAGLEGLPVREEVFCFNKDGSFSYSYKTGFEGSPLETKLKVNGKFKEEKKGSKVEVKLVWPPNIPGIAEIQQKYPSLIADKGILQSSVDKYLIFC